MTKKNRLEASTLGSGLSSDLPRLIVSVTVSYVTCPFLRILPSLRIIRPVDPGHRLEAYATLLSGLPPRLLYIHTPSEALNVAATCPRLRIYSE